MIDNFSAHLLVRRDSRPEVRRRSAGNARHARERRDAELLVFFDQEIRPFPQVVEEPVELRMQLVVLRDLAVRLLYVLDNVEDLTQDSIEGDDRIIRCREDRRTNPLSRQNVRNWSTDLTRADRSSTGPVPSVRLRLGEDVGGEGEDTAKSLARPAGVATGSTSQAQAVRSCSARTRSLRRDRQ
jgi:hypothetical protein